MKKPVVFLTIVLLSYSNSYAQSIFPVRNNLKINVNVGIEKQIIFDGLIYKYTIENNKSSGQILSHIHIGNLGLKNDFKVPSTWMGWYSRGGSFGAAPGVYIDGDSTKNPPLDGIKPGESIRDAIEFEDQGPPVITEWSVLGWAPVPILDEERGVIISEGVEYDADAWADTIMDHRDKLPNANPRDNRVRVMTIGPSKPVEDVEILCDTFILDLMGQVREAASLGWIKHDLRPSSAEATEGEPDDHGNRKGKKKSSSAKASEDRGHEKDDDEVDDGDDSGLSAADRNLPGVAKSIIKKLAEVRRECLRGKLGGARDKLSALIRQVTAQRGKHLTDEAYYLIKFNSEFLLEKL